MYMTVLGRLLLVGCLAVGFRVAKYAVPGSSLTAFANFFARAAPLPSGTELGFLVLLVLVGLVVALAVLTAARCFDGVISLSDKACRGQIQRRQLRVWWSLVLPPPFRLHGDSTFSSVLDANQVHNLVHLAHAI